jgi:hypothetical protein
MSHFICKKRVLIPSIVVLTLFFLDLIKSPVVIYLPFNLPNELMASTIPPIGIFIVSEKDKDDGVHCTLLQHELEHWDQYTRMGLFSFYYNYVNEYFTSGRKINWMEKEARRNCEKKMKQSLYN